MSSTEHRAKRIESFIGICLLSVILIIGVSVFIKQSKYDNSRFGINSAGILKPEIKSPLSEDTLQLKPFTPDGFESLSEFEVYSPENLYEKINGKADQYLESGFEQLFTQRFVKEDDPNLWMEIFIYDMAAIRNAFSVYSLQRRADSDIISVFHPSFGYRTSNALYFCQGKYYFEFVGSAESSELFNTILTTAQNIKTKLATHDDNVISELSLFLTDGIVPGSIKLHLNNTFGFEKLVDTFTAKYKIDDVTITAFFSKRPSTEDAEAIAQSYSSFLIENGAKLKVATSKTIEGKILDFYGTTEIIFVTGQFVAGIHEAESQQAAEKLATRLINKLRETTKSK